MILNQIDGFFPRLDQILPEIKKILLYTNDEYLNKYKDHYFWPGQRSGNFADSNPIFWNYINELLVRKDLLKQGEWNISSQIHLRLEQDSTDDYIHKDECIYSILVYLSDTNYESGTYLYDENKNVINDIKFVQNRLIMFSSKYNHSAYGHHGTDINNGRLTLNLFIRHET